MKVRLFLLAVFADLLVSPAWAAAAEIPAQLEKALLNSSREDNRWAYTETTVVRPKSAKEKEDVLTIVRFDPSKPYAEQYTPLLVEGKKPSASDLKEYRRKGEKRAEDLEKGGTGRGPGRPGQASGQELRQLLDGEHIAVAAETPDSISYRVPLRKGAKVRGVQIDKIEFDIRIAKEAGTIERMAMHLKESMRVMLVANVKSADFAVDFTRVDPKYAPVMTRVQGEAAIRMLLLAKLSPHVDITRKDFERVVPYDDRFQISIGPLNVLK
jgi:hypothetical protein